MSIGGWIDAEVAFHVQAINRQVLSRAVHGTKILRNSASEVLGHDGSGRRYRNGHVASSPGQPPAPDTGHLRRSWRESSMAKANGLGRGISVLLRITSDTPYAIYLNEGTSRMRPRPFIERIKTRATPKIVALFNSI